MFTYRTDLYVLSFICVCFLVRPRSPSLFVTLAAVSPNPLPNSLDFGLLSPLVPARRFVYRYDSDTSSLLLVFSAERIKWLIVTLIQTDFLFRRDQIFKIDLFFRHAGQSRVTNVRSIVIRDTLSKSYLIDLLSNTDRRFQWKGAQTRSSRGR